MTQDRPTSQGGKGTLSGASQGGAAGARDKVSQVADTAKEQVSGVASQAKEQVSSQVSGQKDRLADGLGGVASALRQTGQQLRANDQQGFTGYIDQAADQVERLSGYLRGNDLDRLMHDAEQLARRQPALFLSGAFFLGLLGARFLKSSRPAPPYGQRFQSGTYYGQGAYQGTYYQGYNSGYGTGTSSGYGTGYTGDALADDLSSSYGPTSKAGTGGTGSTGTGQPGRGSQGVYDRSGEE